MTVITITIAYNINKNIIIALVIELVVKAGNRWIRIAKCESFWSKCLSLRLTNSQYFWVTANHLWLIANHCC